MSTQDENLHSQIDALEAAGAEHIYSDEMTGKNVARPGMTDCMNSLRRGDTLLVDSTDRSGRSMTGVVTIVCELGERGVELKSLTEPFDTTTAGGELFFDICAAFAQMTGRIISDRTRAGRPTVMTPERIAIARRMRVEKATWETIAGALQVGVSSVRRVLADDTVERESQASASA